MRGHQETDGAGRADGGGAAPRHGRTRDRRDRVVRGALLLIVASVLTGVASAAALALHWDDNITRVDESDLLADDRERPAATVPDPEDPDAGAPVNLLLLGSDARDGENGEIGGHAAGRRSDVTIVLHVSADRSRVELVSIPRDSMVEIPRCRVTGGGSTSASPYAQFNKAFAWGWDAGHDLVSAASCAMTTVEHLTDVRLDGFVAVDFAGFVDMVDAMDGVPVCIPRDLDDAKAKLHLTAGTHVLDGAQAIALSRARHDLSDGSDTYRMGRQQALLAAMTTKVLHGGVLTDPPRLVRLVDAVTRSLTLSKDVDPVGLAYALRSVRGEDVTFVTTPSGPDPRNGARVVWTDDAERLWERVAADEPIVTTGERPTDGTGDGAGAADEPSDDPVTASDGDPFDDRRPGVAITSADTRAAC